MGGGGKIVEADETYQGRVAIKPAKRTRGGAYTKPNRPAPKRPILALVERGGSVRSFHVPFVGKDVVGKIVAENIARESRLHTDESRLYNDALKHVAEHERVKHSAGEYVRGDIHTNTIEGVFSIFKRGMHGVYQHCSEKHLHRYLAEYDFRYNHRTALGVDDRERTVAAVKGAEGKRLTYRQPH
jgi:hypothetical protein